MAKQTVISPAMAINSGLAPQGVNGAPGKGLGVRVDVFFDVNTPQVNISLSDVMQNGCFTTIQALYIDNSLNPASVIITIPGIQQRIVVNGYTQSLEPIYVSDTAGCALISVQSVCLNQPGFPVSIWFTNVPQPFFVKSNLINNVYVQYGLAHIGNVDVSHSYYWNFDLSAVMSANNVADWPAILLDNAAGFLHMRVFDGYTGNLVFVVNPYSIAQFPTNMLGANLYTIFSQDEVINGYQTGFTYGYDVQLLFKSTPQQPFMYESGGKNGGLFTASYDRAFLANEVWNSVLNESRLRFMMQAPNIFYYAAGLRQYAAVLVNGGYQGEVDVTSNSSCQRGITVTNGPTAQTIYIRDRF